jgi:hypothetical protein
MSLIPQHIVFVKIFLFRKIGRSFLGEILGGSLTVITREMGGVIPFSYKVARKGLQAKMLKKCL